MQMWRISNHADLSGVAGLRASARWHTRGKPIIYLSGSAAGAMVETLVHLNGRLDKMPDGFIMLRVEAPDSMMIFNLEETLLEDWKSDKASTQALGDHWLATGASALARVPSVIIADSPNFLLNPLHPDAALVRIVAVMEESYDTRFFTPR